MTMIFFHANLGQKKSSEMSKGIIITASNALLRVPEPAPLHTLTNPQYWTETVPYPGYMGFLNFILSELARMK